MGVLGGELAVVEDNCILPWIQAAYSRISHYLKGSPLCGLAALCVIQFVRKDAEMHRLKNFESVFKVDSRMNYLG